MKWWLCSGCGDRYAAPSPLETCPLCAEQFDAVAVDPPNWCLVCGELPPPHKHSICHPVAGLRRHGCGHPLAEHTATMRCKTCTKAAGCKVECGVDVRL